MPDELQSAFDPPVAAQGTSEGSGSVTRWDPNNFFWLSAVLPGAGQLAQGRFGAAVVQPEPSRHM